MTYTKPIIVKLCNAAEAILGETTNKGMFTQLDGIKPPDVYDVTVAAYQGDE
jgi:hypothetical protein